MSLSPGMVRISVGRGDDGLARTQVASDRPRGIGATLLRHRPVDIPLIAGRLFALCGHSQSIAAKLALVAAGVLPDDTDPAGVLRQLAGERLAEHLRSCLIGWGRFVPPTPAEAIAARQALAMVERPDAGPQIETFLAELGIVAGQSSLQWTPGSWADRLLASAAAETEFPAITPDVLSSADDEAVVMALAAGGETFVARPVLPDRVAETGAPARMALRGMALSTDGLAGRMAARLIEIGEALVLLQHPVSATTDWFHAGLIENGGYAAVETPRGRLYHVVWCDADGAPSRYLTVAPTEWNFHPHGPFAQALAGGKPTSSSHINDAIAKLAALYDPCVACDITTEEAVDA